MARERLFARRSRRLAGLLLAVTAPPAVTLVWLGVQLLRQDRALFAQRDLERHQAASDMIVRALQARLTGLDQLVEKGPLPPGMIRFVVSTDGVRAEPADLVLWRPRSPAPMVIDDTFDAAERLEFQGQRDRALAAYESASRSSNRVIRAGALLRIARIRRAERRWDDALAAYRALAAFTQATVDGAPADLQARRAICAVLAEAVRPADLRQEADRLVTDLLAGRWSIDRAEWELTTTQIEQWTGRRVELPVRRRFTSSVAEAIWSARSSKRDVPPTLMVDSEPVTILWHERGGNLIGLMVAAELVKGWLDDLALAVPNHRLRITLLASGGALIAGQPAVSASATVRAAASDTRLPWTVVVGSASGGPVDAELSSRRRLLGAGLAAILALVTGGTYFLWRVIQRELVVLRLQTDFVATVSHEFRTPLTSLRHVTELLAERDDMPAERRRAFYAALGRNTERLHRLVESLLDFARMESGRKPYDLQPLAISPLVARTVADFQREVDAVDFTIDLDLDPNAPMEACADAAALVNALWNLLDNAVKYSGDRKHVRVSVAARPASVAIAVQDYGLGIPPHERGEIFSRFVRGQTAARLGIRGTGLGLAMVSHVVAAHGGVIELDSDEGTGSTFTIVLPATSPPVLPQPAGIGGSAAAQSPAANATAEGVSRA